MRNELLSLDIHLRLWRRGLSVNNYKFMSQDVSSSVQLLSILDLRINVFLKRSMLLEGSKTKDN